MTRSQTELPSAPEAIEDQPLGGGPLSLHPPTDHLTGQRFGRSTGERPTDSGLTSSAAVGTCETKGL
jgi:hypothetical protein